jgi:hypothetical protein
LELEMSMQLADFRIAGRVNVQLASPQVALIGSCRHACHQSRGRKVVELSGGKTDVSITRLGVSTSRRSGV